MLRRTRLFWIASIFLATGLFIAVVRAQADPLPAAYSGTTQADLLALNTDPAGLQVGASIGRSATTVDSTAVPRAKTESANLEPKAADIPVGVTSASAHAGNSNPTGSYDSPLGPVNVPSLLTTGIVTGAGTAKWASDIQCLTRPISTSTTTLAGADLGSRLSDVIDRRILHLGTISSTGGTRLRNGSVVSTRSGDLADSTLLGGRVRLHVVAKPTLTAISDGTTGQVSANHYAVRVTVGQAAPVTLHAGDSLPIKVDLGTTTADLTLSIGTLTDTSAGATASGTVTFIRVSGTVATLLGTQTQVDIRLLRLNATATGSAGGVRCDALDAPVITTPASGTTTTKFPAISGTGLPGTTVTVSDAGTKLGATTTDGDGNWSLTPATPLRIGRHTIAATQATATARSARSNRVTITVPDTKAPDPPVITTPSDRSGTSTDVPTVGGTGEPGAKVGVTIDGQPLGTTTVGAGGTWSIRVGRPLADGSHTASARQTDRTGNRSGVAKSTFTVGTAAPAAPVITEPANDSLTDNSTPTISGRSAPGAAVTVTDAKGSKLGVTTAGADGTWSLDSSALHDGTYRITARATGPAGVASPVSAPVAFSIDTWLPIAPVITRPTDGVTLVRATPEISGTGEPGDTVEVIIEATTVGTATVAPDGTWDVLRTAPLPDGTHVVTATQTDRAGNTSPIATPLSFRVDTTAPAPPEIVTPASGEFTNDRSPAISGTAEPRSTVEITTGDGKRLGVVRTAADGTWSLKRVHLHDGGYAMTATATDGVGNTSADSSPAVLTVDTAAPAAPTVKGLTGPTGTTTIADSSPAISGRGEPGATVTVTVDGRLVGMTVVGGDGSWWLPTARFADGRHRVTATQTDLADNTSRGSHPVIFISDSTPPKAPVITSPAGGAPIPEKLPTISGTGEPKATVIVTVDGHRLGTAITTRDGVWSIRARTPLADGRHKITAVQTDAAANSSGPEKSTFRIDAAPPAAPVIATPDDGSMLADNTPTVSGTAEPGSVVIISDAAGTQLGTATVDRAGAWSIGSARLHDGRYKITAVATDAAGNISPDSDPKAFAVDSTPPAAPVIDGPADRSTSADPVPLITGTGEPGTTVRVRIDSAVAGTVTVGGYGTWSLKPSVRLADGDHRLTATQTDAAGNTSPVSDRVLFAVDTTAPAAAVIDTPAAGGLIADPAPVISGTAEPGATVIVTMGGTRLGSAQVGPGGDWSLRPPILADGSHTVTATVIDKANNSSPRSAPAAFRIDTTAPGDPVVSRPADGAAVNDSTPTLSGTGEAGATVAVRVDDTLVGTVKVAADDSWTLASPTLVDGQHTLIATQTDPAGNTSQPSARVRFTVDTHAAAAPVIQTPADGTVTSDRNPVLSGTGERGDTVRVTDAAGKIVATGSVNATGHWSLASSELADGTYSITVRQSDAAGNTSDPATSRFTVDSTAPAAPVIGKPAAGRVSNDNAPTVGGIGEPGAVVSVIIDGTETGTAVVG
ncbi:MAG: hypothetical protein J2P23_03060, partial [Microlunatus sp.]|nr:hypothetical protein [Microlunatus sp.]